MKRPVLIYAVAAATLGGAFLLAPSVKKEPPPPPPKPAPPPAPAVSPVTHLTWADQTLHVDAKLGRGHLLVENGALDPESLWMDVSLRAVDKADRAPLSAVLVIDRSGSMAGDKIDAARMAAERFIRRLGSQDQFAIVSYGTDVSVDLPLAQATAGAKRRAGRVVDLIEEGGGTNIDGALRAASRLLERAPLEGRVGRLVLISDGRPTEGERRTPRLVRHADKLGGIGVTLSTLGVGLDYNEDLMEQLAASGGGRYHYLKRARDLGTILDNELQHATRVVAGSVELVLPAHMGPLAFADAPGYPTRVGGQNVRVRVGDLAAGETKHILFRLDAKNTGADLSAPLALPAPEVVYVPSKTGSQTLLAHRADRFRLLPTDARATLEQARRDDVRIRVLQVDTGVELKSAMRAYAKGDVKTATKRLKRKKAALDALARRTGNTELAKEAKNVDTVLEKVQAASPSSSRGMDLVKSQKARAFGLMR